MFMEALHQKYNEYNDMHTKIIMLGDACPQEMNKSLNKILIALVFNDLFIS